MNKQENNKEDLLREFINAEKIEKAPEGFTEKVMSIIQTESKPVIVKERYRIRNMVPIFSASITIILIIATFFIPAETNGPLAIPGLKLFQIMSSHAFRINFDFLSGVNIPGWLPYLFIGILFFTIFDRALFGVFKKEK
jgi:hypothetical protein